MPERRALARVVIIHAIKLNHPLERKKKKKRSNYLACTLDKGGATQWYIVSHFIFETVQA